MPRRTREKLTLDQVMEELEAMGSEQTKRVLVKHGAREPFFGVKVGDLGTLVKRIGVDHELAMALYATGNSDAMYLAGLLADPAAMSREELARWASEAYWYMLAEYTVPWVAGDGPHGFDLALDWIETSAEGIASAGWATLAYLATVRPDDQLDLTTYEALLTRVEETIHDAPNRVRYTMNGFVIAVASAIAPLTDRASEVARAIGKVSVDMGGTACKVPLATDYIAKTASRGAIGKKRASARRR